MTNNEAIDKLITLKFAQALQAKAFSEDGKPLEPDFDIAVNMAIEALEKQIPQKPINAETSYGEFITHLCPACKKRIALEPCDHSLITHCYWCGKAFDWNEEE